MMQELLQLLPPSGFDLSENGDNAKLWSIFASQMEELSSVFADLKTVRDFQTRSGVILDLLGKMLWEPRDGKQDDEYRVYLAVAIQKMLCSGAEPDISNVFKSLLGNYFIGLRDLYPHAIAVPGMELYLDGSWYLDGSYYAGDGTTRKPAFFDIAISTTTPTSLKTMAGKIISHLRGAGISCKVTELEA